MTETGVLTVGLLSATAVIRPIKIVPEPKDGDALQTYNIKLKLTSCVQMKSVVEPRQEDWYRPLMIRK